MVFNVYRQKRRTNGEIVESKYWYGRLKMPWEASISTIPLYTADKREALARLGRERDDRTKEHNGLIPPRSVRETQPRPLADVLGEYIADLCLRGRKPNTTNKYRKTIGKLFRDCRWRTIHDVCSHSFGLWRSQSGLSGKTLNDRLSDASAFFDWMVRHRLLIENPLKHVDRIDTRGKGQYRRALSVDEAVRLLSVAPKHRAVVYLVAMYTGLRRDEIKKLRWGDVHLDAENPVFVAPAAITKNRSDAVRPLRENAAKALRSMRPATCEPGDRIFSGMIPKMHTFRKDLAAAGVAFRDESGRRIDFHALRVTLCTMLAIAKAPLSEAMYLMRHSDPKLTLRIYTDAAQLNLASTLSTLPSINFHHTPQRAEGPRSADPSVQNADCHFVAKK